MQLFSKSSLLTLLFLLSILSVVLSTPSGLQRRDTACDPNDCDSDFEDNPPSFKCPTVGKRLFRRDIDIYSKREAAPIAVPEAVPEAAPEAVPEAAHEAVALDPRDRKNCKNCAKIKTAKAKFNGKCDPSDSVGFKSSNNCKGKSYLCVIDGRAKCYPKGDLSSLSAENGECFN
ncbi:MAG: hypothetical protein Q9220_006223 [cf. Caloplaca sp. 1 TL-2023]